MMAVMLVLLLATATAFVTVESAGHEAKASGYNRIAVQTKNISESSLVNTVALMDRVGAQSLQIAMQTNYDAKRDAFNAGRPPDEPPLKEGAFGYRVTHDDYSSNNAPITGDAAIGPNRTSDIDFSVDIYDAYVSTRALPGYSADGRSGAAQFLHLTYIARGWMVDRRIEHVSCACVEAGPF